VPYAMNSKGRRWLSQPQQWRADVLLLLVALIWGSTFVLVKRAVAQYPVYAFLFLRFALATGVLLVLFGRHLQRLSPSMLLAGVAIGLFLFGGYAFQTVGLQYTSASNAGFITGLSVVIVPMLSTVLLRRMPEPQALLGVVLATVGLALLTMGKDLRPSHGDLIVLGCAFCYALHISAVSRFAPQTDALALTLVQVAVVAVLSGAASLAVGEWPRAIPAHIFLAAAFTGVLATALAFAIQNAVQARTTATHTALIFTTEPVFAALFGFLLAGESLAAWGWVGCGLILLGMLLAELRLTIGSSLIQGLSRSAHLSAKPAATASLAPHSSTCDLQEEEERRP